MQVDTIGEPQHKKLNFDTYGDHVFRGLELPEGDINGNTTLSLSLELVKYPSYQGRISD